MDEEERGVKMLEQDKKFVGVIEEEKKSRWQRWERNEEREWG